MSDRKPNPLRLIRTVASAFFGVRRKSVSDEDLANLSIKHIIVVAVIGMAVFVATLLFIVHTVVG